MYVIFSSRAFLHLLTPQLFICFMYLTKSYATEGAIIQDMCYEVAYQLVNQNKNGQLLCIAPNTSSASKQQRWLTTRVYKTLSYTWAHFAWLRTVLRLRTQHTENPHRKSVSVSASAYPHWKQLTAGLWYNFLKTSRPFIHFGYLCTQVR